MHGSHDDHSHSHGVGHNGAPAKAAQWQTPHLHDHQHDHEHPATNDELKDLDLVEKAFCEGFAAASDPTSFLRLAGVPFTATNSEGKTLHLLRVEHNAATDVGNITPHLGGGSFRYAPLPTRLASRRSEFHFVYFDGVAAIRFSYAEMKKLEAPTSDV
ncbi:MAG: hypothetical protein KTR19_09145 [Hyphomicrobiales bacterium]|nr:hypothetical protein [Hyphomicrobiales bacterium]